jgi:NAD(P)H dehydrogenase (quinone)
VLKVSKILVLYHSNSGNTRQMAELVAAGAGQLEATEVRLKNITSADHTDLEWCDGIALGSSTNYGSVSWQMKQWWDEQPLENWGKRDGKIGCVFTSAGAWGGGQEWTCIALLSILINYGCRAFGLTDYTGGKFSAHYGAIAAGRPAEATKLSCSVRFIGPSQFSRESKYLCGFMRCPRDSSRISRLRRKSCADNDLCKGWRKRQHRLAAVLKGSQRTAGLLCPGLLPERLVQLSLPEKHVLERTCSQLRACVLIAVWASRAPMIINSAARSGELANCSFVLFAACCLRVSDSSNLPLMTLPIAR